MSCCNITNTIGSSVLTLKWYASFLVSNTVTPKYLCFLCMWDSRAQEKHWVIPTFYMSHLLIEKVVFPPLHIKLGLMKQFVKALKTEVVCFKYLILAYPGLSIDKIKAGVFDSLQIKQLIKDDHFIGTMSEECLVII